MTNHFFIYLFLAFAIIIPTGMIYLILRSRYRKYTDREYILRYRGGQLIHQGIGGAYFLLPFIDEVIALSQGLQRIDFLAVQEIIFKPKFKEVEVDKKIDKVEISGLVTYTIDDPRRFYEKSNSLTEGITGSDIDDDLIISTNKLLRDLIESRLKERILDEALDQLYQDHSIIRNIIKNTIIKYQQEIGIEFHEILVSNIELVSIK